MKDFEYASKPYTVMTFKHANGPLIGVFETSSDAESHFQRDSEIQDAWRQRYPYRGAGRDMAYFVLDGKPADVLPDAIDYYKRRTREGNQTLQQFVDVYLKSTGLKVIFCFCLTSPLEPHPE